MCRTEPTKCNGINDGVVRVGWQQGDQGYEFRTRFPTTPEKTLKGYRGAVSWSNDVDVQMQYL